MGKFEYMKYKEHKFVLTVKTCRTKQAAKIAVLSSFALRKPDACEFRVIAMSDYQRQMHRRVIKTCDDARKRMNSYTPEQRAELEKQAREIIEKAAAKHAGA